jgi:hypothetical protein
VTAQSPYPYQTQAAPATPAAPRNGLGTAGFTLGLIGLLFSPIPLVGVIAWPLVILGLIFSPVGYARARRGAATNRTLAMAGIVLSAIGLVVCIIWAVAFSKAVVDTANSLPNVPAAAPANGAGTGNDAQRPAEHVVVYKVTGTGRASSITYTTDGMSTTSQASDVKLPWEKTIKLPSGEPLQLVSLLAQGSGGKGAIKATIEVDGKVFKEADAQGYGMAIANGDIGSLGH